MRKRSIGIYVRSVRFLFQVGFQRKSVERLWEGTHSQNDLQQA